MKLILITLAGLFIFNVNSQSQVEFYDSSRQNLKLSIPEKTRISNSFYFSNDKTKDSFVLTIEPGLINKSKSKLQIFTKQKKLIYEQVFDTFFFIRGIFQPDSIPSGGQDIYERYARNYRKSLTKSQYDTYLKRSIDEFYRSVYFIDRERLNEIAGWGEVNKDTLNEVIADKTIKLVDIACFNCDEGGVIIFYSKKLGQVKTLLAHD